MGFENFSLRSENLILDIDRRGSLKLNIQVKSRRSINTEEKLLSGILFHLFGVW